MPARFLSILACVLLASPLPLACGDGGRHGGGGGGGGGSGDGGDGDGEDGGSDAGDRDAGGEVRADGGGGGGSDAGEEPDDTGGGGAERPAVCRTLPDAPAQPPLDLDPGCAAGGEALRIMDLRDERCRGFQQLPTAFPGREVVLEDVVVTGNYGRDFTVQDPSGSAYGGLWVFTRRSGEQTRYQPGQHLRIEGTVIEFFTLTEISPTSIEVLGGGAVPDPVAISDPRRLADGGDLGEPFESMLVVLPSVKIESTVPDCPLDFGMFVVSGGLRVDDEGAVDYVAARGDVLSRLVGVAHYSFDHWKLLPRDDDDLDVVECDGLPDKCEAADCIAEPGARETGRLVVSEIQDNPEGDDSRREWLELHNPSRTPVELSGWTVKDCAGRTAPLGGVVPAGGHWVIASALSAEETGGVEANSLLGDVFLPNGFGSVLVYDSEEALVDQVRYEVGEPWPDRGGGHSLSLRSAGLDNADGASWAAGATRYGDGGWGTPGAPNSR